MQAVRLRQDQLEMSRPAVRTAGDGVTLTWFERRRRAKLLRQARQQARQQQQQPAAQQGLVAGGAAGRLTHRAWLRR